MTGRSKGTLAAAGSTVVLAAALTFMGFAASAQETGCVYSGGGWICAGEQPPSQPGELPTVTPEPVETIVAVIETPTPTPAPVVEEPPVPTSPAEPAPSESSVCIP